MGVPEITKRRLPSPAVPRIIRHGSQSETNLPRCDASAQAQLWWRRTEVRPRRCRQPDRPRPRLRVRQHGPGAMDVLPRQAQGFRHARPDVERQAPLPHPYPNMWRPRTIPSGRMLLPDRAPCSRTCQPKTARPPVRTAVSSDLCLEEKPRVIATGGHVDRIPRHHRRREACLEAPELARMSARRLGQHARRDPKRAKAVQDRPVEAVGARDLTVDVDRMQVAGQPVERCLAPIGRVTAVPERVPLPRRRRRPPLAAPPSAALAGRCRSAP